MKRYEFDSRKYCINKNTELWALRERRVGICTIDAFLLRKKNGNLGRNIQKKIHKREKAWIRF